MPELSPQTHRRIRLMASLALASAILVAIWQLLGVLLPFLVSGLLAYLLLPAVSLSLRTPWGRRWPRASRAATAGAVTLLVIAAVLGLLAVGIFRLVDGSITLAERAPGLATEATMVWEELQDEYSQRVPANIQEIVNPRLDELRDALIQAGISALRRVSQVAQSGISQVVGLAASPIILFYLLYQPATIGRGVQTILPGPLRDDLSEIGRLAGESIGAYLRMQLLLGALVGVVMWLALWVTGIPFALPLGVLAGLAELVPIVGPTIFVVLAGIVIALVDLTKLPLALGAYLIVQILQNTLVTPRMQGQALGLHPLAIVLALAVFGLFFGFLGTLLAAPLTAAGYRVLTYTRNEWASAGIVRLGDDTLAAVEIEEPNDPGGA